MTVKQMSRIIKAARLKRGLTQEQVGKRAGGLSRNTVSNIERGIHCALHVNLERVARAVGVKL